jgi:2-iminobutanoate/2-iminopropanoate deaminase
MPVTRGNPPGFNNVRASVYNHFVRIDLPKSLIFVWGQRPRDSEGNQVGVGSMLEQTRQCLRNLEAVAQAGGAALGDAVRVGIYVTDMGTFAQVNEAYATFFDSDPPARSTIGVAALPLGAQVEIDAIVALPD